MATPLTDFLRGERPASLAIGGRIHGNATSPEKSAGAGFTVAHSGSTGIYTVTFGDSSLANKYQMASFVAMPSANSPVDVSAYRLVYDSNSYTDGAVQINCYKEAAAGVAATCTINCVAKNLMADTDYITLNDGLKSVVFEFDTAGDGVTAGRVQVNISGAINATDVAVILVTAINASDLDVTASNASGVVTVTHNLPGADGNATNSENVAEGTFTLTSFTGGADPGAMALTNLTDNDYIEFVACFVRNHTY